MSLLRDGERAKFAAELLRLKTEIEAHAAGVLSAIQARASTLDAMKARTESETETFGEDDTADVQEIIDLQASTIAQVVAAVTPE